MEFLTSKTELKRRKIAYLTLLVSLTFGLVLSSWLLDYSVSSVAYSFLAVMFFLIGVSSFLTLNSMVGARLVVRDDEIERIGKNGVEKYSFANLKSIAVKRRTNGIIRELVLVFDDGSFALNSFEEDFEKIFSLVTKKVGNKIVVKTTTEPIDYDHPLFYSVLGLPIGFICVWGLKTVENLNTRNSFLLSLLFSIYLIALGLYFIFAKPLATGYGRKQKASDFLYGGIMISLGAILLFITTIL